MTTDSHFEAPNRELLGHFACTGCGADLTFKPGTTSLSCGYCGNVNEIPQLHQKAEEQDLMQVLSQKESGMLHQEWQTVSCKNCAATTTFDPKIQSNQCPYCLSPLVIEDAHTESVLQPGGVLPFKIAKEQAREAFKQWVKKRWFAPNDLQKATHDTDRFNGLYTPYWTFDADTHTNYVGQRGDYYYTTETYTTTVNGKSETRTRQVRHTRWTTVSGHVNHQFDDVLVLASNALPRSYTEKLEPWDLEALAAFNASFLAGFITEKYQITLQDGFEIGKQKMSDHIHGLICSDIGGDEQRVVSQNTDYEDLTFKYILLPIYVSAYRYKNKVFRFVVNGRTGEVQGERPYSAWKIALLVVSILAIIGLIIWLVNYYQ